MSGTAIKLSGGGYTAVIDEEHGANCISLRHTASGARILRERGAAEAVENPYLYGMPILYPVNRIAGGKFTFEGRHYSFPVNEPQTQCHLHGTLHNTPFAVTASGGDFVTCVFDRPYLRFPHRFRLELTYRLSADGMEQTVAVTNRSAQGMPHFLGFHTTLCVPFLADARAEDVRVLADIGEEIERDARYLPTGRILPPDAVCRAMSAGSFAPHGNPLSRNCRAVGEGRLALYDTARQTAVFYEVDRQFGWRLVYGQGSDYICLEPMTCIANCQNAPFDRALVGFDSIPPWETRVYRSKIFLKAVNGGIV